MPQTLNTVLHQPVNEAVSEALSALPSAAQVLTEYRPDPDPALAGNPMALAFPPPRSDAEVFRALAIWVQPREAGFALLPLEQRLERLDRLDCFHYPFPAEIDLLHRIVSLVRKSFLHRNPSDAQVVAAILAIAQGHSGSMPRLSPTGGGGGLGLLLAGPSGTGKSSFIDRVVEYFGAHARVHTSLNGRSCRWTQLGAIRVAVQSTWKSTLEQVVKEVDRQLGSDYFSRRERYSSRNRLEAAAWGALTAHFAPLVIFDELQRLRSLHPREALRILHGLVDLMEQAGLPVIVVGTLKVKQLFEEYPSHLSKFSNAGIVEFARLAEGEDTDRYIEALQQMHASCTPMHFAADFRPRLLLRSMGVHRIMREFMHAVLHRHALDETLTLNAALLDDIAHNEMRSFEDALDVLRRQELGFTLDYQELQRYEDFLPPDAPKRTPAEAEVELRWQASSQEQHRKRLTVEDFTRLRQEVAMARSRRPASPAPAPRPESGAAPVNPATSDPGVSADDAADNSPLAGSRRRSCAGRADTRRANGAPHGQRRRGPGRPRKAIAETTPVVAADQIA